MSAHDLSRLKLSRTEARQHLQALSREVARHDRLYHELDAPEIEDADYDRLRLRLEELEAAYPELVSPLSPTERVGGVPARWLSHRQHALPMLSLRKVRSAAEWTGYADWVAETLDRNLLDWCLEPKLDGVALEVVYEHGQFAWAATRGDGSTGEDVTRAVRRIVPDRLEIVDGLAPARLEVRGEAVLSWGRFAELNQERALAGEAAFVTPRGAVAGGLRHGDVQAAWERGVRFVAWGTGAESGLAGAGRQNEILAALSQMGLETVPCVPLVRVAAEDALEMALCFRESWRRGDDPQDGVVLKLADVRQRQRLGATATAPRWGVAVRLPEWERAVQ